MSLRPGCIFLSCLKLLTRGRVPLAVKSLKKVPLALTISKALLWSANTWACILLHFKLPFVKAWSWTRVLHRALNSSVLFGHPISTPTWFVGFWPPQSASYMWGARVTQWLERWPPTSVAWVRFPTGRHMWVEFVVGPLLAPRGFSSGTPVFPSPQKPTFSNSN